MLTSGKKIMVRAVLSLELDEGATVQELIADLESVLQLTGDDYGNNVIVLIE